MSRELHAEAPTDPIRTGYIALVGRPNVGKSTLMNRLVGQKLSIVTSKAQTTWQRVAGIRTTETEQAVFLDTPGLLLAKDLLQRGMLEEALEAIREADVVVLLLDATDPLHKKEKAAIVDALAISSAPRFVVISKIDRAAPEDIAAASAWAQEELGVDARAISALLNRGVEELWEELAEALPAGPFLYPPDDIASAPVRFFVAEVIRETVFEQFKDEVPYSVFAVVEEFREDQDPVYIQANLFTERNSQKRIVIGKKGRAIRGLGRVSREKIQEFIDRPVYLDLWVKVLPNWRRKRRHLRQLGLRLPPKDRESPKSS